ncbi:HrgA protein [Pseudoalteromonas sp. OFAV1]|uniref:HrgA protein n=1 Tax=Pseudoalteromonas sp. OFAV1 TaxID=2908892 RepID=UPI001F370EC7|nr:HrgA protein [Pseudoalteromonas sp. OFAV1]MCF2901863.1 HrgA protein [Pseudoalteromonas sp. OFAV1]
MSKKMSQADRIISILQSNRNIKFTAKEIAVRLFDEYRSDYQEKDRLLKESGRVDIITQLAAEIGSQKSILKKKERNIHWHDEPKKRRVYWYGDHDFLPDVKEDTANNSEINNINDSESPDDGWDGREETLYPLFNKYLYEYQDIYPLRIDEKRSKNRRGNGGNEWLHPDIVALNPIAKKWMGNVMDCANMNNGELVNLWSFEVKKQLTTGNVRKHYFQAVSNSSWANYGYLVAISIESKEALLELKMLHALHGIGVIVLDIDDIEGTEILLPAKKREQVDWESVNRLSQENKDFNEFVNNISDYLKTSRIRRRDWSDLD